MTLSIFHVYCYVSTLTWSRNYIWLFYHGKHFHFGLLLWKKMCTVSVSLHSSLLKWCFGCSLWTWVRDYGVAYQSCEKCLQIQQMIKTTDENHQYSEWLNIIKWVYSGRTKYSISKQGSTEGKSLHHDSTQVKLRNYLKTKLLCFNGQRDNGEGVGGTPGMKCPVSNLGCEYV